MTRKYIYMYEYFKKNFKLKKKTLINCKILSVQSPSPINKSNSVPYCN